MQCYYSPKANTLAIGSMGRSLFSVPNANIDLSYSQLVLKSAAGPTLASSAFRVAILLTLLFVLL